MEQLLLALRQPEHLHVLLNHIPIIGLAAGIFVLLVAFFQKSRPTAVAAYLLIALAALSVFPVSATGEKAEDGVESLLDVDGEKWLHEHGSRAEQVEWIFYVTAAASLAGLAAPKFFPRFGLLVMILTGFFATAAFLGGVWTASSGGKIMHREFRYSSPVGEKSVD